jgi:acyl-CoA dehydrogenase family protein 9
MEMVYDGSIDASMFRSFRECRNLERVQSVFQRYRELLLETTPSEIEKKEKIPDEMLKEMGKRGFFGITIPEAYGGLGFSLWEYLKLVEEMAAMDISVALISLAHLSIGSKGIVLFGSESQKQKYLTPAASGAMIFSYALTEPKIGSDARHIETTAELSEDGAHYILNGQKTYITNANYAGGLTVFAQMNPKRPGFMGAFIVETNWEGVQVGKDMPKMGLKASSTAAIQFRNVRVPKENLIGKPGDGFNIAMAILNYGRLGLGAASVGMMERSVQDMLKRARSRVQFGVPIQEFPLIQEKIVQAKVYSFISSAMNNFTAGLLEENPAANVAIESSHCKLFGTTRAWDALYNALQVAGGAGYLSTQPYEKRMRDFRVSTIFEGTTEIHSIYPALFALRKMEKQVRSLSGGKPARWKFLLKKLTPKSDLTLSFDEKTVMNKALRFAMANAGIVRRMLAAGSILYGKKIMSMEFLLRRISTLSLYLYGILAALAKISADREANRSQSEDLLLLSYFLEEAKEVRKVNKSIFASRKEKLNSTIFKEISRQ